METQDPNFEVQQLDGSPSMQDPNAEQYAEMDLTPYEEDDDATLHQKLVAAKIARKRAEDDLRLLTNRISLLKQEESRAFKKIEQTRKKAGDIVYQRRRNMESAAEKQMRQQMKLNEEAQITLLHRAVKEEQEQKIAFNKAAHNEKVRQDVSAAKEEKAQQKELYHYQNHQHSAKATMIKTLIKQQQEEAKQKKQADFQQKKMRARQQMNDKLAREEQQRLDHERNVQLMEQEELALIQRLKDTQAMQQAAFQNLEDALNGGGPPGGSGATGNRRTGTAQRR